MLLFLVESMKTDIIMYYLLSNFTRVVVPVRVPTLGCNLLSFLLKCDMMLYEWDSNLLEKVY